MKTSKAFLSLILFSISILSWGQTQSIEIVKKNYPQIYTSIVQEANNQWGNDEKMKLSVIDGQAKAFLYFAESSETIDNEAMTQAIVNNSLPGTKSYNTNVINDLSIPDPFPLLKCDWYKVKASYEKNINSSNHRPSYSANRNSSASYDQDANTANDDYPPMRTERRRRDSYYSENLSNEPRTKLFNIGVTARAGISWMLNTDSELDSYPGVAAETGISAIFRFKGGFYIQNDLTVQYLENNFEYDSYHSSYYDYYDYTIGLWNLQYAMYFGFYKNINSKVRLLGGLGPYAAWTFSTDDVDSRYSSKYDYSSYYEDNFTFGIGTMFGIELKKFQFGIYPSIGLTSTEDSSIKPLNILFGATFWFN